MLKLCFNFHRIRLNDRAIFDYAYDIARHHHEKYDGKGYPDGLKGDAGTGNIHEFF